MSVNQRFILYLILCLLMGSVVSATDPWMEKFLNHRKASMGPTQKYSVQELKQFLSLEGQPIRVTPIKAYVPENRQVEEKLRPVDHRKQTHKKKIVKPKPKMDSADGLLRRARWAYDNGQFDRAGRLYKLVLKVQPASQEAMDRLEEITRDLR
ncbi:MAG: hypothetical protein KCHDKBKB_02858 [Elusimicrobia bacterium]|nr:hypothetical protein [Elusimicrobiota bacterium]